MKNKPKTIMAAVDLSRHTEAVLEYAVLIARALNARLIIVNVINNRDVEAMKLAARTIEGFSVRLWTETEKKGRRAVLEGILRDSFPEAEDVRIIFRLGVPFREILDALDNEGAEFLIIGPKGKTDDPEVRVGVTTEKVLRRCSVPLLVVRNASDRRKIL